MILLKLLLVLIQLSNMRIMFRNSIKSSLSICFFLLLNSSNIYIPNSIAKTKEESEKKIFIFENINFENISNLIIKNNLELKSLKELVNAASFNLSSKISKRYPSLDLSANGLPQYLYGKNYNSSINDTKTSQLKFNPSLNLRWDLIDPQRGLEINTARNNYEIAINNYEIKKKDLIREAKSRYHEFQKSNANKKNSQIAVSLSNISLKDAQSKLKVGIGTKFDVLEANAQLARDKQLLEENKISSRISEVSLKEILNLNLEKEIRLNNNQKLIGFWHHSSKENIYSGIKNSYSLKNKNLQRLIKNNESKSFQNANLPVIYISNSLSTSFTKGSALTNNIDSEESASNYLNTISLNFTWSIFNGGANQNSYKSKQAEIQSENYSYLNLKNSLIKNINETYLNLIKYQKKLVSTQEEINASKESLRLSRLRYEVGISTLKDVLIRQKELTNARSKKINSIYSYNINLDRLERLTFLQKSNKCQDNKKNKINSICNY